MPPPAPGAGGRPASLNPHQTELAQQLYDAGDKTVQQIADILAVPRTTIYGHLSKTSSTTAGCSR